MAETEVILSALPAPVWAAVGAISGALVGGVAAFITSIILNHGNNTRLNTQLEHDRREKGIDRLNNLRRDVYLSAVEEMTKASSLFASLPSVDLAKTNVAAELQGLFVSGAKLSLVASPRTQNAMEVLGVAYSKLMFETLLRLSPLQECSNNIALNSRMYDESMTDVRRVLGELTRFSENARTEEFIQEALQASLKFFSGNAQRFNEQMRDAQSEFSVGLESFNKQLFLDMAPVAKLQVEVLIAIRNDLGIETDDESMRERQGKHWAEVIGAAGAAMDELNRG